MNSTTARLVTPLALVLALAGCDQLKKFTGKSPKGQVVATIDGQEVTSIELQNEIGGQLPPDPKVAKAVEQAVLQRIIARDVLANKAHAEKLDQTPDFAVQMARAKRELQVSLLERRMANDVPAPSRDEAEHYVSEHPTMFAQRQLFVVEQIQTVRTLDQALIKSLAPMKTLEEIETLLVSKGAPHQRTMTIIDGLRVDPRLIEQINKLPAGEPFIVPTQGALTINQVKETRNMAFTGDAAVEYALRAMRSQRAQEAVAKQGKALLTAANDRIKYNDAFKPPPPGASAPAAAAPAVGSSPAPAAETGLPAPPANATTGQPYTLGGGK